MPSCAPVWSRLLPKSCSTHLSPRRPTPASSQTRGLARPADVTLVPFYRLFFERYALYWNVLSPDAYARRQVQDAQEQRDADTLEARTLEARTVDRVRIGETASEAAHALASDRSRTGGAGEPFTHWRDAQGFFSYTLKVPSDQLTALRCVYWGSDAGRTFDILVDGAKIATETLTGAQPGEYLPVTYPIPPALAGPCSRSWPWFRRRRAEQGE